MPSGILKLIGVLLLVGSIGVVGVQACTTGDPRPITGSAADAPAAPPVADVRHG